MRIHKYRGQFLLRKPPIRLVLEKINVLDGNSFRRQDSHGLSHVARAVYRRHVVLTSLVVSYLALLCYVQALYSMPVNSLRCSVPWMCGDGIGGHRKQHTETWRRLGHVLSGV